MQVLQTPIPLSDLSFSSANPTSFERLAGTVDHGLDSDVGTTQDNTALLVEARWAFAGINQQPTTCEEDREPGPSHASSKSVVPNLHKSYKACPRNPHDPNDRAMVRVTSKANLTLSVSLLPHLLVADVVFSFSFPRVLLLAPQDKDQYHPIMDIEKTIYTIVDCQLFFSLPTLQCVLRLARAEYLTPDQRDLVGNTPSDLLTDATSPLPSPSTPSPAASQGSSSSPSSLPSPQKL
ncbi:hypothetical protein EV361DRAFT_957017 [Lentinula raphanica]|nr:hypothetical protein EV361DRAFT_957017 [Lentinula raphanica]